MMPIAIMENILNLLQDMIELFEFLKTVFASIKSFRAISRVDIELKLNVSETGSASIVKVDPNDKRQSQFPKCLFLADIEAVDSPRGYYSIHSL
jgi:hypothetical protein